MSKTQDQRVGALAYIFSRRVARKSAILAAIVGSLLSLVNQADVLLREQVNARIAVKILFNFLVPFVVASVSALLNRNAR
ncbi:MAG: hypothetical protein A3J28_07475 [Acidobacteria bacterium RIFCSPLOWO2_12_FULL_60_22]|nr:MAG: hypothetical protein A3J28_07475 [Acidobacteria bacterium RIFCSPLOWO2_12_FULL_60_22]